MLTLEQALSEFQLPPLSVVAKHAGYYAEVYQLAAPAPLAIKLYPQSQPALAEFNKLALLHSINPNLCHAPLKVAHNALLLPWIDANTMTASDVSESILQQLFRQFEQLHQASKMPFSFYGVQATVFSDWLNAVVTKLAQQCPEFARLLPVLIAQVDWQKLPHNACVVHGDVHLGNMLLTQDQQVRLIDPAFEPVGSILQDWQWLINIPNSAIYIAWLAEHLKLDAVNLQRSLECLLLCHDLYHQTQCGWQDEVYFVAKLARLKTLFRLPTF